MDTIRFNIGDQVVFEYASSAWILGYDVNSACTKGPFTVIETIEVPLAECNCYAEVYRVGPHMSGCPKGVGPWGFIGHPQWIYLADAAGDVILNRALGEPSRFSGAWFAKYKPGA